MHKNELTECDIVFVLYGYESDTLTWFKSSISFFEANGYPLNFTDYLIDMGLRDKWQRKNVQRFFEIINENPKFPFDEKSPLNILTDFDVFAAKNRKAMNDAQYHYGCSFNQTEKRLELFFDTSYGVESIVKFCIAYLQTLLTEKSVWLGYSFATKQPSDFAFLQRDSTNYKEGGDRWNEEFARRQYYSKKQITQLMSQYRHIYIRNILSKTHVEEVFDEVPLIEWVANNNYGVIEKIGMENWLWTVHEDKLHEVQMIFYERGLLIGVE